MGSPALAVVQEATARGHTVLPVDLLRQVLGRRAGAPVTDADLEDPALEPVLWDGEPALSLAEVAESEELLADGLAALAAEGRLAVAVGTDAVARTEAIRAAASDPDRLHVVDDAHRVGVDELLPVVEDLAEDVVLVLSIDPHLPLGHVTGAVALDVAASGVCPVLRADSPPAATAPARAAETVATGSWPGATQDRAVVAVAVGSPDEAVHRVRQLVTDSIPRTFGVSAADVAVRCASSDGPTGAAELAVALGRPVTGLCDLGPADAAAAAVVVLDGPDGDRALLYAALRSGARHVSLVHPAGLSLAQVAARPARARRTRLRELLAGSVPVGSP